MATLTYWEPAIFLPEGFKAPPVRRLSAVAGHTGTAVIIRGDVVVLAAGSLNRGATNSGASIAGYAVNGENATFQGSAQGVAGPNTPQLFGFSQVNTLLPADPGQMSIQPFTLGVGVFLELNLSNTTGWITGGTQQASIGTTGGLLLDATTNRFVFDPTQVNKVMTIYSKPQGPEKGTNGDLAARVLVYFNSGTA